MAPNASYSSSIDDSLYIRTAVNSTKHGGGSVLAENGAQFFGSSDQYLQSTNALSDFYVDSKKLLKFGATDQPLLKYPKSV